MKQDLLESEMINAFFESTYDDYEEFLESRKGKGKSDDFNALFESDYSDDQFDAFLESEFDDYEEFLESKSKARKSGNFKRTERLQNTGTVDSKPKDETRNPEHGVKKPEAKSENRIKLKQFEESETYKIALDMKKVSTVSKKDITKLIDDAIKHLQKYVARYENASDIEKHSETMIGSILQATNRQMRFAFNKWDQNSPLPKELKDVYEEHKRLHKVVPNGYKQYFAGYIRTIEENLQEFEARNKIVEHKPEEIITAEDTKFIQKDFSKFKFKAAEKIAKAKDIEPKEVKVEEETLGTIANNIAEDKPLSKATDNKVIVDSISATPEAKSFINKVWTKVKQYGDKSINTPLGITANVASTAVLYIIIVKLGQKVDSINMGGFGNVVNNIKALSKLRPFRSPREMIIALLLLLLAKTAAAGSLGLAKSVKKFVVNKLPNKK